MRENAHSQIASEDGEQAEESAEYSEQHHVAYALISMRSPEEERRKRHTACDCAS